MFFFFQAEDGIRDDLVTGVQTCALPILGKNPNGVGYVGMAYTKAGGVKAMPIDGAVPSTKSVQAHTYPYWRPTFYYTNGDPSGLAKDFVDFTVGPGGQRIVAQGGFVPIQ